MNARRGLFLTLLVVLTACGQDVPQTVAPGQPVPVTYYPTPTRRVPTPAPTATALPATETPAPTVQPTPTEDGTLSTAPIATLVPTIAPTAAPTQPPLPTITAAPVTAPFGCAAMSAAQFDLVPIDGAPNNALADENADLRLSILGVVLVEALLQLVDYPGDTDGNAPRLHGMFQPNRTPQIIRAYKRRDWNWDRNAAPPYGTPGGVNNDWPVSTIDLATTPGEAILIPQRGASIYSNNVIGMVLYAAERELTIGYARQDAVGVGYVVHMLNLCVDPNLVTLYRAQLSNGKRSSNQLPGIRANQSIGTALAVLTVAIRDRGAFFDPRSRKDWWQGAPQP